MRHRFFIMHHDCLILACEKNGEAGDFELVVEMTEDRGAIVTARRIAGLDAELFIMLSPGDVDALANSLRGEIGP